MPVDWALYYLLLFVYTVLLLCALYCAQRLYVLRCFAGFCSYGVPDHISVSFCDVF